MSQILSIFKDSLPHHPFCNNYHEDGLLIRSKAHALRRRHVQFNAPGIAQWLVFDCDKPSFYGHWDDLQIPAPNLSIYNPENQHHHAFYLLKAPVCTSANGRAAPLKYLAAIEAAYIKKLNADICYTGLIAKNPLHSDWITYPTHSHAYELSELADYVDLTAPTQKPLEPLESFGLGRNCDLFDQIRFFAYKAQRDFKKNSNFSQFEAEIYSKCAEFNVFSTPLPVSELRAIAKSVAKFCWRLSSEASDAKFSALQAYRGQRSGLARLAKSEDKRATARLLSIQGKIQSEIAAELGVSRKTVNQWLRSEK